MCKIHMDNGQITDLVQNALDSIEQLRLELEQYKPSVVSKNKDAAAELSSSNTYWLDGLNRQPGLAGSYGSANGSHDLEPR
jgi:hypothetical protein